MASLANFRGFSFYAGANANMLLSLKIYFSQKIYIIRCIISKISAVADKTRILFQYRNKFIPRKHLYNYSPFVKQGASLKHSIGQSTSLILKAEFKTPRPERKAFL